MTAPAVKCPYAKCWCEIRVDLELRTENERLHNRIVELEAAAKVYERNVQRAFVALNADKHTRALKLLIVLSGGRYGYEAEIDEARKILLQGGMKGEHL